MAPAMTDYYGPGKWEKVKRCALCRRWIAPDLEWCGRCFGKVFPA